MYYTYVCNLKKKKVVSQVETILLWGAKKNSDNENSKKNSFARDYRV